MTLTLTTLPTVATYAIVATHHESAPRVLALTSYTVAVDMATDGDDVIIDVFTSLDNARRMLSAYKRDNDIALDMTA